MHNKPSDETAGFSLLEGYRIRRGAPTFVDQETEFYQQ